MEKRIYNEKNGIRYTLYRHRYFAAYQTPRQSRKYDLFHLRCALAWWYKTAPVGQDFEAG